jgi:hypothetical protein
VGLFTRPFHSFNKPRAGPRSIAKLYHAWHWEPYVKYLLALPSAGRDYRTPAIFQGYHLIVS